MPNEVKINSPVQECLGVREEVFVPSEASPANGLPSLKARNTTHKINGYNYAYACGYVIISFPTYI